jgi:phospholipid/cholesterol/gamma-HCH transport system substrate-binding protein
VRVDGIKIGTISSVKPEGDHVDVTMHYRSSIKIGANAYATVISTSLVSDRYVQLTPLVTSGKSLASGATIALDRTYVPVEIDDVYASLNKLSVALGPNGANKNGALSNLLAVASNDLSGNGAALGQTIDNVSKAAQTLADGREDLFGTVTNLENFVKALQASDANVRTFNTELAQVAGDLADERTSLATALNELTAALDSVAGFIQNNQAAIQKDVSGLVDISNILVKDKGALNETLAVAPVALANLVHTYNAGSGTLDQRSNLSSLTDAGSLCSVLNIQGLLATATAAIQTTCQDVAKGITGGLPATLTQLQALLSGSLLTSTCTVIPGVPC